MQTTEIKIQNNLFLQRLQDQIKDIEKDILKNVTRFEHASVFTHDTTLELMCNKEILRQLNYTIKAVSENEKTKKQTIQKVFEETADIHLRDYMSTMRHIRLDYGPSHMLEQRIKFESSKKLVNIFFKYISKEKKAALKLLKVL